jgi:hypothetical protein
MVPSLTNLPPGCAFAPRCRSRSIAAAQNTRRCGILATIILRRAGAPKNWWACADERYASPARSH